ncbi:ribonuclease P protein subunit Rpp14 [Methanocella conradii HZ254]|uniref:Ribonuclease P protein component 2 n=1 Tax=Methanocella conradii (strain DSM 24694 / JCM 17849 / CGMCC 1.5162 / HZ254) TaxID=1041930 RepID=H8IAF7_METCZ|nr:Rpp14/Pop5 family protein [Methanocella conradii]AFC99631.1 ribonuclease P protein subunit Rpp14 [Methanocella conradii HZ254]
MKILPSSLREKKRYIAFEVACESEPVERKALLDEVFFATQALLGDVGSCEIGYRLMDFNGFRGIMRVNLKGVELARAAMATVCSIKGSRAAIRVLGVAGTIKAATEKYIPSENISPTSILSKPISSEQVSGTVVRKRGDELEIVPDDKEVLKRANVHYVGLTSFDLRSLKE